jgi:xanthine dehydrogenase accessory factor
MTPPPVDASGEVRARADELRARREPFVAATVVRAERPTSAKPGDSALVLADGTVVGFVGGACAQSSVRAQAVAVLAGAEPVLLRITPSPGEAAGPVQPGTVIVHNPCLSGGTLEIFLEPSLPAPLLLVHGEAPIAVALAGLAEHLGYAVSDWRGGAMPSDTSAVVVASHGRDEPAVLRAAVLARVPYIGLVASRRRGDAVLAELELADDDRSRIHTPAGLDIGARTPGEVALSILAEIVAMRPRPVHNGAAAEGAGPTPGAAVSAVDPVCGMTVAAVDASLHVDHAGVRYWFCGSGCMEAFSAGPGAFVGS